jgi:ssDNA-binding replication factor A large subunit
MKVSEFIKRLEKTNQNAELLVLFESMLFEEIDINDTSDEHGPVVVLDPSGRTEFVWNPK